MSTIAPSAQFLPINACEDGPRVIMTTEIALSRLIIDRDFNARLSGNREIHVQRLMESDPSTWPPPLVTPHEDDYLLLDGNHRVTAAMRLGIESLRCQIIERGGYGEAVLANIRHGLPLTIDDRKRYARWLHEQNPFMSYRELGRRCSLNHETIKSYFDGESSVIPQAPKLPSSAISRLVSLILRATDNNEGIDARNRDQRALLIQHEIDAYLDVVQADVAYALNVWGKAMQAAAAPYLKVSHD